ncbi:MULTISPECIES: hypothetical protein, partial [unclassified Mammaliicoccus]|uniref:LPXTG cell wall anchor domain-containing protein n=2 Tax=Mammaliicoccus TaxID=2803850 RepID=UPI001EFBDF95
LNNQKEQGKSNINNLSNLTAEDISNFTNQIANAKDKSAIDKAVQDAQIKDATNLLNNQKEQGKSNINNLSNLTAEDISNFTNQITNAKDKSAIDKAVQDARNKDATNLLNSQKDRGQSNINELPNLTDEEKAEFNNQITNAVDKAAIDKVVANAKAKDDSNLLNAQRNKGNSTINGMSNLTDEEKANFSNQITNAENKAAIDQVVKDAEAQDAQNKAVADLQQAKENAQSTLDSLANLTDDARNTIITNINEATSPEDIANIVSDAKQQDKEQLLSNQKEQGKQNINDLANLSDEERNQFEQQITDATDKAAIDKVIQEARDKDASNLLNSQKDQGHQDLNNLANLSDEERNQFEQQITDATDKAAIDKVIQEARDKDVSNLLNSQKDQGRQELNDLSNLTDEERNQFEQQISDASNQEGIHQAVNDAKLKDAENKAMKDLADAKSNAQTDVDNLTNLNEQEKANIAQQLENATSRDEVSQILKDAQSKDASNLLNKQKEQGTVDVDGLTNLSDEEKEQFKQQISDATDETAINEAINNAKAQDIENKATQNLENAKNDAQSQIDNMEHLTDEDKSDITQRLEDADNPETVADIIKDALQQNADNLLNNQKEQGKQQLNDLSNLTDEQRSEFEQRITDATNEASIKEAINEAKAQDADNKSAKDLSDAKEKAQTDIEQLDNLSEDEKTNINQQLKDATSPEEVAQIIKDAQNKDDANFLDKQKQQGSEEINNLGNLTDEEKEQFKQQITDASDKATIDQTIKDAKAQDVDNKAYKDLSDAKEKAQTDIDQLTNLTDDNKTKIAQQLEEASSPEDVKKIVDDARNQDAQNLLDKQKQQGTTDIDALINLSDEEKEQFKEQVSNATDETAINEAINDAIAKDIQNKAEKDLSDAKDQAKSTVDDLTNLTEDDKINIKEQLDGATTPEDVLNILKDAQEKDENNLLEKQKQQGNDDINELDNLTQDEQEAFNQQIKDATTKSDIDKAVQDARNQDADNLLNSQKEQGKKDLSGLSNLTDDEREDFEQQIVDATGKADIDKIVQEANAKDASNLLENQKVQGAYDINDLSNLSDEEKSNFNQQITDATTKEAIDKVIQDAREQDASNLLENQKSEGNKTVNDLSNLSDEEKSNFNQQITDATTKEAINKVIQDAREQDVSNLLMSQKEQGNQKLNDLINLTDDDRAEFEQQIANATDKEAIDKALQDAKNKDLANLNENKTQGNKDIDALANLSEEEKSIYTQQIAEATTKDAIDLAVQDAKERDANNLLSDQKQQGNSDISNLSNLSENEKNEFAQQIYDSTDKDAIDKIVQTARKQDATNLLNEQKNEGQQDIDSLGNLTEEDRIKFEQQITDATDKTAIDKVIQDAKDKDASNLLNSQKDNGQTNIDALENLSDEEKGKFSKQVSEATTKEEIDKAVADAKSQDIQNKADQDLSQAKKDAQTQLDQLANLTDEEKEDLQQQLESAETPEEVGNIVKDANETDASNLLNKQKENAQTEVNALNDLSEKEKAEFNKQIQDTTTKADIDKIVEDATNKSADNLLNNQKDSAQTNINGLNDLSDKEKSDFNKQVQDATTKEEIDKAVADAKAQDIQNKADKDLAAAKEQAKEVIDNLGNLSDEDKAQYKENIDSLDNSMDIAEVIEGAQDLDASNLLNKQKDNAAADINGLEHLSEQEKETFNEQIENAKDKVTIDQIVQNAQEKSDENLLDSQKQSGTNDINNLENLSEEEKTAFNNKVNVATSKEEIDKAVTDAKAQDIQNKADKDLAAAKEDAKNQIDQLTNLTEEEKADLRQQLESAETPEEVGNIVKDANETDASNLLNKQIENAQTEVNDLNDLSEEEKAEFNKQIQDATTKADIDKIVEDATDKAADNLLNKQKENAQDNVNGLNNLSDKEKSDFNKQVQDATTKADIDKAVADAKAQDANNLLSNQKDQGQQELDSLNNLTDEEKTQYKEQLNNTTSKAEIDKVISDAKAQDASNLLTLQKAKGQEDINSLKNLTEDELAEFAQQIENAKDKETIDKVVQDAKEQDATNMLNKQKGNAKTDINMLEGLSHREKEVFNKQIDDATDKEELDKIVQAAKDKAEKNILDRQKQQGTNDVNSLDNLSDKEKSEFNKQISSAKSKEEIDKVVSDAKAKDIQNKAKQDLVAAKDKARSEIDQLNNLTDKQKGNFQQQIEKAQTPEDLVNIIKDAQTQDAQNALNNAKDNAKQNVNDLVNLSYKEKSDFNKQIDDAQTQLDIDKIVNKAQIQNTVNLNKNQDSAQDIINDLPNIDNTVKNDFNNQVDQAITSNQITDIIKQAQQQDANQLLVNQQSEGNAKINALPNLDEITKQQLQNQIVQAPNQQEINRIVSEAKRINNGAQQSNKTKDNKGNEALPDTGEETNDSRKTTTLFGALFAALGSIVLFRSRRKDKNK